MTTPLYLPKGSRILVIALRRLGDVLLATPLIRSMRAAWPSATIDVLVFANTAGILEGNPDINNVITMPAQPSFGESIALARSLWRRYALAVSTQAGDRPSAFAFLAGKVSVALGEDSAKGRWKSRIFDRIVRFESGVHRVEETMRFADALGIPRQPQVVPPRAEGALGFLAGNRYAVIHAAPFYRYKQWTDTGWRALAADLRARKIAVVTTGGGGDEERAYLDRVWQGSDVRRLDGRLNWQQLAALLAGAEVYVGPDTSVTHLAAATGCRTVALFGPTDPRLWGPWPYEGLSELWLAAGSIQHRGNVWLVQNAFPCLPCQLEGCERKVESESICLMDMAPQAVIAAIDKALAKQSG